MLYKFAQKALFASDPERAHRIAMESLRLGHQLGATRLLCGDTKLPVQCMGLEFPNPVGVAAGLDKNADYFEALGGLGFGFVEVGTITPRAQAGNPRPRIFRLPQAEALINRLAFNSKGVDYLVSKVRNHRFKGILGINIGKNLDTPIENSADDYLYCLQKVYPFADYITVNISSPNTSHLRTLQAESALDELLGSLADKRHQMTEELGRRVPLAVKVAPDLELPQIRAMARVISANGMDAVIATNTTLSRAGVLDLEHAEETGGLSGAPLKAHADQILQSFRNELPQEIALIGVGGITTGRDATDKLERGADLVQFYTGMIYRGPALLGDCLAAIKAR